MITKCGVICATDCHAYNEECAGCNELAGKISWAKFLGLEKCPIYSCVVSKGLSDCGQCGEAPCRLWLETRDPSSSDQQFKADLDKRLVNLKNFSKSI